MPLSLLATPLADLRRALHASPKLSGDESRTADQVADWLIQADAAGDVARGASLVRGLRSVEWLLRRGDVHAGKW